MAESGYQFIVGENGRRSGLAVAGTADAEVRILVLPKRWRPEQAEQRCSVKISCEPLQGRDGVAVSIVCYEKDTIRVEPQDPAMPQWPSVRTCFDSIAGKSQDVARSRRAALVRSQSGSCKCSLTISPPVAQAAEDEPSLSSLWRSFLKLRQRAIRYAGQVPKDKSLFADLASVSALESTDSLLSPLVRSSFVSIVEDLIHHVRPGYSRVTEPSRFIRGRMDPVSAAIAMAGGSDAVVCTFDSFGLDTPLLRVIAAALREVADHDQLAAVPSHPDVVAGAHWLLEKLEAVHYSDRNHAARLGYALLPRLPRLDGDWLEALRLACLILDDRAQDPLADSAQGHFGWHGTDVTSFIFDVNTATWWERIVRQAWPGRAKKGYRVQAWLKSEKRGPQSQDRRPPGMQADILAGSKRERVVADVKYSDYKEVPGSSIQQQVFTYSHLYEDVKHVFVIYAGMKDGKPRVGPELNRGPKVNAVTCQSVGLRFPGREDVDGDEEWASYLGQLGESLRDIF